MQPNLLLVDDEEDLLTLYTRFLRKSSIGVDTAINYEQAIHLLESQRYDVVISDLCLTQSMKNEGFAILRRAKERNPHAKLILTTGYERPDIDLEARELGVERTLFKPFSGQELKLILQQLAMPIDDLL